MKLNPICSFYISSDRARFTEGGSFTVEKQQV